MVIDTRGRSFVSRASRGAASAAAIIIGAVLGLLGAQLVPEERARPDRTEDPPGVTRLPVPAGIDDFLTRAFDPDQPLMVLGDPIQVSAHEAAAKAGRAIYLPKAPPGDDQTPEVWYSNQTGEVAVRYGDTLVLTFDLWEKGQQPAEEYAQQAADWKAGVATEIAGHPAWVVGPEDGANVPLIHITFDEWDITLYGRMTTDQLRSIAGALQPTSAG